MLGKSAWILVYEELRAAIVNLEMKPGEALAEKELCEHFGISRTPVREAILRLADEHLLEIIPQTGTFVSRIPYEELPEAMVIRKSLEGTSSSVAAERATRSQVLVLASIIEQQREAAANDDVRAFHLADEAFHAKIAAIAGYPALWRLVLQVKTQVDRFRQFTLLVPNRMEAVIREHEAILEAIGAADPEAARKAMALHLDAVLPGPEQLREMASAHESGARIDKPAERLDGRARGADRARRRLDR